MGKLSARMLAAAILAGTPMTAMAMTPAGAAAQLVEDEGLRTNQFVTEAALWIVFKIEAGQMAAELGSPENRQLAEQMVALQREEALGLTEYARAAHVEADALNRLQTHHPLAHADGPETESARNFRHAREATQNEPGSGSRTSSPEAPAGAALSATQAGQMIERRLEQLRETPPDGFDHAFCQHLLEASQAELALYEAYAADGGRPPLTAYAEERLPELRQETGQVQSTCEN